MSLDTSFNKKEHVIQFHAWIYPSQKDFLLMVAAEEKIPKTEALREILDRFQKAYLHRRGEFICQCCGTTRKNKERHAVRVENEELSFGDCCYYSDKYKEVLRQMI